MFFSYKEPEPNKGWGKLTQDWTSANGLTVEPIGKDVELRDTFTRYFFTDEDIEPEGFSDGAFWLLMAADCYGYKNSLARVVDDNKVLAFARLNVIDGKVVPEFITKSTESAGGGEIVRAQLAVQMWVNKINSGEINVNLAINQTNFGLVADTVYSTNKI